MKNKIAAIRSIGEYLNDVGIDDDWLADHVDITLDESTNSIFIAIEDIGDQELREWEGLLK